MAQPFDDEMFAQAAQAARGALLDLQQFVRTVQTARDALVLLDVITTITEDVAALRARCLDITDDQ